MATRKMSKLIKAPPSEIYLYFTNSTALREWLCDVATAEPRPGGRLYMWWNSNYYTSGEYLDLQSDQFISFSWFGRGEPHATRVDISLKVKKTGTLVKLTHCKLGNSSKWKKIGDEYEREWLNGLENLASVLENGPDLRLIRRPMLGIAVNDFDAKIAEKIGVPVFQGLRLSGVIKGLGAEKAGLQADDVITRLDDSEITGNSSFSEFIEEKHAGETIEVTFYRCSEKKTAKMTLSSRPIPPISASGAELSSQIKPVYQRCESELEDLLKDTSEEACAWNPSPIEWSVNEVLAHLIHSELGWQNIVTEILGGHESTADDWGGNIQAHILGTVETFATKGDLLNEVKNHLAETMNIYTHIPAEFIEHKGKWWKLAYLANQNPDHFTGHIEQIRAIIQARKKD